ncbi:MAG: 50S ribosomal protein L15 [Chloroflexota bacterium]
MKLHDLHPAPGSRRPRTRVGRGIAAGKGKTAGRGTKGQKARTGGSIPPWFEGGQTPLHQRIPKLRGFRNPLRVEYEVVNVGRIAALVEAGRIPSPGSGPVTVTQEILRAAGLVSTLRRPLKVLGAGDVTLPLFVIAEAFSRTAREKIEAAGGTAQLIESPAQATGSGPAGSGAEVTAEATGSGPAQAGREPAPAES